MNKRLKYIDLYIIVSLTLLGGYNFYRYFSSGNWLDLGLGMMFVGCVILNARNYIRDRKYEKLLE